jgi:hypothetical protein
MPSYMPNITTYVHTSYPWPTSFLTNNIHQKAKNTLEAIPPLLRGLFAAEFRGHWPTYRIGIALLADLALDLEMRKYGRKILDEVMPQVCFHFRRHNIYLIRHEDHAWR